MSAVLPGVRSSVLDTVGRTPLCELGRIAAQSKLAPGVRLLGKLESRNPCGSVKDRIGAAMVDDAERRGILTPGATLIEPTTGNTGVALAFIAASRGYKLIVTMPERMSRERAQLLRYFGAQVIETPGALMRDAVMRAEALKREIPGAVLLEQFKNPANPEAHRRTTAIEIWDDTGGAVDVFVAGVGTGGTITGVGEVLKLRRPSVRVVAVEPAKAAVLSPSMQGQRPGNHMIQGIGAGFVPSVLNREILDEVQTVSDSDAFAATRRLARDEGILAGISSGAALAAALVVAARPDAAGKVIVVMLPDTGERYVTTPLFQQLVGDAEPGDAPMRQDRGSVDRNADR